MSQSHADLYFGRCLFIFITASLTSLSDVILRRLSRELKEEWIFLGLELGYERVHLQDYIAMAKNSGNLPAYCMLKGWQSGLRSNVDEMETLEEALQKISKGELIELFRYELFLFSSLFLHIFTRVYPNDIGCIFMAKKYII